MYIDILFYAVFLSQVILLSYYYPNKINQRIKTVLTNYPPAEYPKLYPESIEKTYRWQLLYKRANQIILTCGLILLFIFSTNFFAIKPNEKIALLFGFIQFFPLGMLEVLGRKQLKLMRKANKKNTRKAELNPRHLSNYVAMKLVYFAAFMITVCMLFVLYKNKFMWNEEVIVIIISIILTNGLYVGIVFFNLYGKKLDPHQMSQDRAKQISAIAKSMTMQSIVVSLFLTSLLAMEKFKLEQFDGTAFSLYWQLLAILGIGHLLKSIKVEEIDFSFYKANAADK